MNVRKAVEFLWQIGFNGQYEIQHPVPRENWRMSDEYRAIFNLCDEQSSEEGGKAQLVIFEEGISDDDHTVFTNTVKKVYDLGTPVIVLPDDQAELTRRMNARSSGKYAILYNDTKMDEDASFGDTVTHLTAEAEQVYGTPHFDAIALAEVSENWEGFHSAIFDGRPAANVIENLESYDDLPMADVSSMGVIENWEGFESNGLTSSAVAAATNTLDVAPLTAERTPEATMDMEGTVALADPNNANAEDGTYAVATATEAGYTAVISGFAFAIPTGAIIDGIEVKMKHFGTGLASVWSQLLKGYGLTGDGPYAPAIPITSIPGTPTWQTAGGPTDKWSVTNLSPTTVNDISFGISFSHTFTGAGVVNIDCIKIKVYYHT
jgi:hypothetical protein